MATQITAAFAADFSRFVQAVNQAETRLRDFQSGSKQVEAALTRMGDAFSGRKILQEASLAVKAVGDLGGVSKLTESEQQRLNATLTEAMAKYRALGQTAPTAMRELAAQTKDAAGAGGGLITWVRGATSDVVKMAAGFFTAQAAFAAVKGAIGLVVDELKVLTTHGATVADVADNFEHLTEQSGRLGSTLLTELRSGTHGTITDFELMKVATQDLAAGMALTDEQFGLLAKGAFALAQATGTDVKSALDTMNDAMLTGRTRSIALLTGKIDLEKAEQAFARSLGRTREELSEEGKLEAARIAILTSVGGAIERLGEQTDGLDERIAQARTAWANFQDELGRTVASSPVIAAALDTLRAKLAEAFGGNQQALIRTIADLIDQMAITIVRFGKIVVTIGGEVVKEFTSMKGVALQVEFALQGMTLAALAFQRAQLLATGDFSALQRLQKEYDATWNAMKRNREELGNLGKAREQVDATTAEMIKGLDAMIAAMEKARQSGRSVSDAVTGAGTAAGDAGRTIGTAGRTVTDAFLNADKAAKGLAKTAKEAREDYLRLTKAMEGNWQQILSAQWEQAAATIRRTTASIQTDLEKFIRALQQTGHQLSQALLPPEAFDQIPMRSIEAAREAQEGLIAVFREVGQEIPDAIEPPGGWRGIWNALTSSAADALSGLNDIFQRAFEGGGGVGGAIRSFATSITASLLNLVPAVGPILSQFAGAFVAFGQRIWGWITGGPSRAELEGRQVAASFTAGLERELTSGQLARVQQLVSEGAGRNWSIQAVALQDAFVAAGRSADEALVYVDRLWRAEEQGAGAVQAVMAELQPILDEHAASLDRAAEAAERARGELARLSDPVDILQEKLSNLDSIRQLQKAFEDARRTGTYNLQGILNEVERLHESLGDNAAVLELMDAIRLAVDTGVVDFERLTGALTTLRSEMSAGINIPVRFDVEEAPLGEGREGTPQRGGYLTPAEAKEAGVAWIPKAEFDWSDAIYRAIRDEDQSELNRMLEENSFQGGTAGRYLDFGAGTPVMLHGRERIMTAGENETGTTSRLEERLASIENTLTRFLQDQPRAFGVALRDAFVLGGVR